MKQFTELIERVKGGDEQAFEILYQYSYRQIYYTCMSFLKNEQDVYDMMQETYITALTHISSLENPECFMAWLSQIAVNKCKDFLRKKQPIQLEEELMTMNEEEVDENFLPESYVVNEEKRKILLDIMQEQLSAVQYQTVILYYFDGLSISEISTCMQCPEGTVKYRLSTARASIKKGVEQFENLSGQKLYSVNGIAVLTAVFYEESKNLMIPNVLTSVMSAITGAGTSVAGSAVGAAVTGNTAGAAVAGKAVAKKGIGAFFKTLKGKLVAGAVATAVVAGGVVGIVNFTQKEKETKPYQDINVTIVDDDYMTVTLMRIYDKGYIPEECKNLHGSDLGNNYWSSNDCIIQYEVVNKTDTILYLDHRFMTGNNEAFDYDTELDTTWRMEPNQTMVNYMNNHGVESVVDAGREPIEWAKVEAIVYQEGVYPYDWNVVDYVLEDVDLRGNGMDANYTRPKMDDREQVVIDNDEIRVTFVGTQNERLPMFYVENKKDEDIKVEIQSSYFSWQSMDLPAKTTGYITRTWFIQDYEENYDELEAAKKNQTPIPFTIRVQDYSFNGGNYVNYKSYYNEPGFLDAEGADDGLQYNFDLQDKLAATSRDYQGEFVYFLFGE